MIKRIGLLLVAALMAAMMLVATAAPAFADSANWTTTTKGPNGQTTNGNCGAGPQVCTTTNHGGHVKYTE